MVPVFEEEGVVDVISGLQHLFVCKPNPRYCVAYQDAAYLEGGSRLSLFDGIKAFHAASNSSEGCPANLNDISHLELSLVTAPSVTMVKYEPTAT